MTTENNIVLKQVYKVISTIVLMVVVVGVAAGSVSELHPVMAVAIMIATMNQRQRFTSASTVIVSPVGESVNHVWARRGSHGTAKATEAST